MSCIHISVCKKAEKTERVMLRKVATIRKSKTDTIIDNEK